MSLFNLGLSGLKAAHLGLNVTGHDIANIKTPGYSRQVLLQAANIPLQLGNGFLGTGVNVEGIVRMNSQFLNKQVQLATTYASYYEQYLKEIEPIDALVGENGLELNTAMRRFFESLHHVATSPSDMPAREVVFSSAQNLLNSFQFFDQALSQLRGNNHQQIQDTVTDINTISTQIAELNKSIVNAYGLAQSPNDLLDQRDELVRRLNEHLNVSSLPLDNGSMIVVMNGNIGLSLVHHDQVHALSTGTSSDDPEGIELFIKEAHGDIPLEADRIKGGRLQGLITAGESLATARATLDRLSLSIAHMVNAQHRAGQTLESKPGEDLFSFPRAQQFTADKIQTGGARFVVTSATNTPLGDFKFSFDGTGYHLSYLGDFSPVDETISGVSGTGGTSTHWGVKIQLIGTAPSGSFTAGIAFPPTLGVVAASTHNPGSAQLSGYISKLDQLTDSSYRLFFDGTNYTLERLSDGVRQTFTQTQMSDGLVGMDGFFLTLTSGTPKPGDRFLIRPSAGYATSVQLRQVAPEHFAAAGFMEASLDPKNTGSLSVEGFRFDPASTDTLHSAYSPQARDTVSIKFTSPTQYNILDSTGTAIGTVKLFQNGRIAFSGWTLDLMGTPAKDDKININLATGNISDGNNAVAMAGLQERKLLDHEASSFNDIYSNRVAAIGAEVADARSRRDTQAGILKSAEERWSALSSPNLDEEAARLMDYQQKYSAATAVIRAADNVFQLLLAAVNR